MSKRTKNSNMSSVKMRRLLQMLFCSFITGFNSRNKQYIHYPNVPSAIRPVPHGPDVPIPTPPALLKDVEESDAKMSSFECQSADDLQYECNKDHRPTLFGQEELNDLVQGLDLPKLLALLLFTCKKLQCDGTISIADLESAG